MAPRPDLLALGLKVERPPFTLLLPAPAEPDRFVPAEVSFRPADEERWASLRFRVPLPEVDAGAEAVVKQWVNDWWPPPCPDLPIRDRASLRFIPSCADTAGVADVPKPAWWAVGQDYHGTQGLTAHLEGTNVEVRLPDSLSAHHPVVSELLSTFAVVARGPERWIQRAYHPKRDIPDRGWGDNIIAGLDWSPFAAAPEHPDCPAPDLLDARRLPSGWVADATGARSNPRMEHHERQWVVTEAGTGNPLLWARAIPLGSRHRYPLLARADSRYRLDWEESPVGWAGSLDTRHGHHVVLLERGGIRIEVWIGLHGGMDRNRAAVVADRLFL